MDTCYLIVPAAVIHCHHACTYTVAEGTGTDYTEVVQE